MVILFETERLIVIPFTLEDTAFWKKLHQAKDITKYTFDGFPPDEIEIKAEIALNNKSKKLKRWKILLKTNLTPIGLCGFKNFNKEFHLGFRILKSYRRKGYATEAAKECIKLAFKTTGLKQIKAYSVPQNKASIKVLLKCGFEFEKIHLEDNREWLKFYLNR